MRTALLSVQQLICRRCLDRVLLLMAKHRKIIILFFGAMLVILAGEGVYLSITARMASQNPFEQEVKDLQERLSVAEQKLEELQASAQGNGTSTTAAQIQDLQERLSALAQDNPSSEIKDLQSRLGELARKQESQPKESSRDELMTAAVQRVAPTVVSIVIAKDVPQLEVVYVNPFGNDPFFKDVQVRIPQYRQKGVTQQKVGAGTGFLVSEDGYILTNRHVVGDESASYTVLLSDGSQKKATVVYKDTEYDLAVVKIEGKGYATAPFGDSASLKLGQTVIAIGNALGEYSNSVSTGIISGLNRTIQAQDGNKIVQLSNVLQTDAAINPGNSGGPLLDLNGKVIGVNVATVLGSNNISFAIPSDIVKVLTKRFFGN